jgi:hypothetical protein
MYKYVNDTAYLEIHDFVIILPPWYVMHVNIYISLPGGVPRPQGEHQSEAGWLRIQKTI